MKAAGRYEIRNILGEGGMGIVYLGFDPVMNREVTIKTIRDPQDKMVLELFKRECAVLASMSHPNIVEIFDIGEVEESGVRRPYFVMPLLPGVTLQELIKSSSPRLTVERSIQMMSQSCRGLQAAHEHNLVHRDLKPSNLFILDDDSVKIIDFGVAHMIDHRSATGLKGTLLYMAPEQIQRRQPTPLADQFSLAVVAYEVLARRHPFGVAGEEDLAQAILRYTPPPISEFNPVVSPAISQVVHKALAKEPFYRFSGMREFSDCLQKALRGESIDIFDQARVTPRVQRARKAFDSGDIDDASEILSELESESYLTPEIGVLRKEIEEVRRAKTVKQLLETARKRFDEEEYVRALQKVQEVLDLDPTSMEAFTLKVTIESKRSGTQIEEWFRFAHQHMENHAYALARQALQKVLDIRPKEARALALLTEVERREQEYLRLRNEKQQSYQSAVDAYQRGEIGSALNKMERVLDLDRRAAYSTSPEQGAEYQRFYEEVCSKRDQLSSQEAEARRHLSEGNFVGAVSILEVVLASYPNNVVFRVLSDDVEQAQRQEIFAYMARIDKDVVAEPDLDRKVAILEEAQKKYPSEQRFEQSVRQVRTRRDTVNALVGRARMFEESRQFSEALGQWEILRNVYPQYPGLDIEIDRLKKRREQQARTDAKAHWVTQVEQAFAVHNYDKAAALTTDALAEFPNDSELLALGKQVQVSQQRAVDAEDKASRGKELCETGSTIEGLGLLREAFQLDAHNSVVRQQLVEFLLKEATARLDENWKVAEPLVREALELDPGQTLAKSLGTLLRDKRQDEEVSSALSNARDLQTQGSVGEAIKELDKTLAVYPRDARLIKVRTSLSKSLSAEEREKLRLRDLEELTELAKESKETSDLQKLESIFDRSQVFTRYEGDADFRERLSAIEDRVRQKQQSETDVAPVVQEPGEGEPTPPIPSPNPVEDRPSVFQHKTGFFGRIPRLAWGVLSFGLVLLVTWWINDYSSGKKGTSPGADLASRIVPLRFINATLDKVRVFNSSGVDVSDSLANGLVSGNYNLTASKPGFQPIAEYKFTIDAKTETEKTLELPWQALPTGFRIEVRRPILSLPLGSLKVDGTDRAFDDKFDFQDNWSNGDHSLVWITTRGDSLAIDFGVADDTVVMKEPMVRGAIVAMIATFSKSEVEYQAIIPSKSILKILDGIAEEIPSKGRFQVQNVTALSFKMKSSNQYPLGGFDTRPDGQPAVLIHIAPQPTGSGVGRGKAEPVLNPLPTSTINPPAKSQEEVDRDRKKQEDDKKKQDDEKRRRDYEKKLYPEREGKQ